MKKRSKVYKKEKTQIVTNTQDVSYKDKDNTLGYAFSSVLIIGLGIYQYLQENTSASIFLIVIGVAFIGMSIYENKRVKKLGIKKKL